MANIVNVYVLYNGTSHIYVGDQGVQANIACDQLQTYSPRPVWLKRILAPGDGTTILYEPTFNPSSDELLDVNTLAGFWITVGKDDLMVDIVSANALKDACNACCGAVPTIVNNNFGGIATAFTPFSTNFLCIYRTDDGSAGAHDAFAADYTSQYVGKVVMRSNFSFGSHYTIQTYWTAANFPVQGSDVVYAGACSS